MQNNYRVACAILGLTNDAIRHWKIQLLRDALCDSLSHVVAVSQMQEPSWKLDLRSKLENRLSGIVTCCGCCKSYQSTWRLQRKGDLREEPSNDDPSVTLVVTLRRVADLWATWRAVFDRLLKSTVMMPRTHSNEEVNFTRMLQLRLCCSLLVEDMRAEQSAWTRVFGLHPSCWLALNRRLWWCRSRLALRKGTYPGSLG